MNPEKRRVHRVMLETPITGWLGKHAVTIIDLSTIGARVEHPTPIAGKRMVDLRFNADCRDVVLSSEIVRSRLQRSATNGGAIVYSSGLRFSDPGQDSRAMIRNLVAAMVSRQAVEGQAQTDTLSLAV